MKTVYAVRLARLRHCPLLLVVCSHVNSYSLLDSNCCVERQKCIGVQRSMINAQRPCVYACTTVVTCTIQRQFTHSEHGVKSDCESFTENTSYTCTLQQNPPAGVPNVLDCSRSAMDGSSVYMYIHSIIYRWSLQFAAQIVCGQCHLISSERH
jgi:hypothetical protein